MRLMRVGPAGHETPVAQSAGSADHYDLTPLTPDIDSGFLADGGLREVGTAITGGALKRVDITEQRIGPPVARPGAVLCVGMNYAAHAAESGGSPPDKPIMFLKSANTIVGPTDPILIPRGSRKTDYEVELGVIIGRRARYLDSPSQALEVVAGYTVSNDVSERAYQLDLSGGQWSLGKCCESFNPLGPWLVTPDDIPDVQQLRLTTRISGQTRQDSTTSDMIFTVAYLVWYLSQFTVLEPGDLINTGTPEGVALSGRFPYLSAGDLVETAISGLGSQHTVCLDAP